MSAKDRKTTYLFCVSVSDCSDSVSVALFAEEYSETRRVSVIEQVISRTCPFVCIYRILTQYFIGCEGG